jgi:two-component system, response regulator PdtaR
MCHVLVIEDEPLIAILIGEVAELAGATSVVFATSESEALSAARESVPAVILSDADLKGGGTGPNACAAILAEHGSIPVIFITATPALCYKCDYASAVLSKPIEQDRVIAAFRKVAPPMAGQAFA